MPKPQLPEKYCQECLRKWKLLSYLFSGTEVLEAMAAHDCDGVGVMAIWKKNSSTQTWNRREITTEEIDYDREPRLIP